MNKSIGGTWWELDLIPGWKCKDNPECLTVTKSDEGAFQLSSSAKTSGIISGDEVLNIARMKLPPALNTYQVVFGEFSGYEASYIDGNVEWRKYWLACENILLFITYNGSSNAIGREEPEVKEMLSTLRLTRQNIA